MAKQPIQTRIKLLFTEKGTDVTHDITADLLDFTYDDKETNEAEEISIKLKDDTGKWAGTWQPNGGEVVRAFILPGDINGATGILYCGKFYVDELNSSGPPQEFELKAVSIPLNKPIRKKLKTRAWEKKTLKGIATTIAKEANITLLFDSKENPSYDRQEQSAESDLKFLSRLCEDVGLSIKITDEKLVIFDQASYEKKSPIKTLELKEDDIKSWNFRGTTSETYKSCTIKYRDPTKKVKGTAGSYTTDGKKSKTSKNPAVFSYTYVDPLVEENGQEYTMKKRAKSVEEAKRLAKAKLRKLNARSVTGNITVIGDISLLAGVVIRCKNFGKFDGNFIIEQATHSISSGSGYTTSLSLRRVNNKY